MINLRSKITTAVLNYFFLNPEESLYVNELVRKLELDKRNLVKKIRELEEEGILKNQKRGNLKFYSINKKYPLYDEYRRIVLKSIGFEAELKKIIEDTKGVKGAYIYGSYVKNKMDINSDIDLLVIGSHQIIPLQRNLNKLQKKIDREINVVNIDENEFKKRKKNKDPFILSVFKNRYIKII
jgi:predicted nucleotidyltransferase